MRALTVRQPWAWAIFHGKPVENRSWATKYRGDLLIHARKQFDLAGYFNGLYRLVRIKSDTLSRYGKW
jgi:hypothetical protein